MAKITAALLLVIVTKTFSIPIITRMDLWRQAGKSELCTGMKHFNDAYYTMEEVKKLNGIPADMNVHWKTGNIYYTLISETMKMSIHLLHESGDDEPIRVIGLGQSTCVDNLNDIVYLATDNGVYKLKDDMTIEPYAAVGEDTMYIALTQEGTEMYVATWPQNRVQKITNDGQSQEPFPYIPNGHGLTSDPRNHLYFVASKRSYILKNGHTVPVQVMGLSNDKLTGVYVSRSDNVFAMDESSNFFKINAESATATHLGNFNVTGVNTFALDASDNVLIGVKGKILKFITHETNPCIGVLKNNKIGKRHNKRYRKPKTTSTTTEADEYYD